MQYAPQTLFSTLVPFVMVASMLVLRMRRMNRSTRLYLERLWLLPAFYALMVGVIVWVHPPHGMTWLYAILALLTGVPLGWYRGKLMQISIDPQTHVLSQRTSPAAMLFILALLAVRYVGRALALANGGESPDTIFAITDILLAFALGFLATQRLEMALRAKSLLAQARNDRT